MICLAERSATRGGARRRNITPYRRQSSGANSTSPANRKVAQVSWRTLASGLGMSAYLWKSGYAFAWPGTSAKCHVWTAPCWQELFGGDARLVGAAMCPAFLMRRLPMAAGHNALREIGSRSLARSQELPWHEWGVPISGSTGWVHYSRICPFQPR